MKSVKWFGLAIGLLILASIACGGGAAPPTQAPPTQAPPTQAPPTQAPPTEAPGETASLEIINNSNTDIWYLYVAPSSETDWGDDQLGATIVYAGESFTLTDIPYGTYDLLAEDSSHTEIERWMGVEINEDMTWTVIGTAGSTASLEIINASDTDIWYLYISPSSSTTWGDDQLGAHIIAAGERYTITDIPAGTYDLKAEDSNHNPIETWMGVEISGAMGWTVSGGEAFGQWAIEAAASSEYSTPDWSAMQATGEPDTSECGDFASAWASSTTGSIEWLELTYATPVIPRMINIHETQTPGFITRVEVIDLVAGYHIVWEGAPGEVADCPRIFSIPVTDIDFPIAGIRITLDLTNAPYWNEIDAVELIGTPAE